MEKIYNPKNFRCTDKVNLKEAIDKLTKTNLLNFNVNSESLEQDDCYDVVCKVLGFDDLEKRRLIAATNMSLVVVADEDSVTRTFKSLRKVVKLINPSIITNEARSLGTIKVRESYRSQLSEIYSRHRYHRDSHECKTGTNVSETFTVEPHCTVSVRIYNPFCFTYTLREDSKKLKPNSFKNVKFTHQIETLGTNTLTELRDRILCYSDLGLCVEVEDPKTHQNVSNAKEIYPSGFFFIENVFYNDRRHPDSIDYSEPIRKWGVDQGLVMETGCMASTRIQDLTVRLGYPYVYQHQGKCEHIFVFSDIRLLSKCDNNNIEEYPLCTGIHHHYTRLCGICSMEGAKWICVDSDRLPQDRMLLCNSCFQQYNYVSGKKVGSFKAYPYFNKNILV